MAVDSRAGIEKMKYTILKDNIKHRGSWFLLFKTPFTQTMKFYFASICERTFFHLMIKMEVFLHTLTKIDSTACVLLCNCNYAETDLKVTVNVNCCYII